MSLFSEIREAREEIRKRSTLEPTVGVVLGSGLGAFANALQDAVAIAYNDIPGFAHASVEGHAGTLLLGTVESIPVAVMSGRVHFYEGHTMERVTFGIRVLRALGVRQLVATNAAGAINPDLGPGHVMLIRDHINLTGHNPLRGPNDERLGPRFPDMSNAYPETLRARVRPLADGLTFRLGEGVYAGVQGPAYETPAEIHMLRVLGADAVGMSTVAETLVAVHAGMTVLGMSVLTNWAAGLGESLSHEDVQTAAAAVQEPVCLFLTRVVQTLGVNA